ncbi:MAG: CT583 family protein, partial [Pyrinomonadaceae bacterium]
MPKVNDLLSSRLKQKFSKMTELAEVSSRGQLSSFSGVFRVHPLSDQEQISLEELLKSYQGEIEVSIEQDLLALSNLTSEIKAISNQAAILHGERIKKAQEIFKNYRDGAFSAWLLSTYGNRQTPYNFLQYYEFYLSLPSNLLPKLDEMPRQAIYTLASRDAPLEKKKELLENYRGEK